MSALFAGLFTAAPGALVGAPQGGAALGAVHHGWDFYDRGRGRIAGTLKVEDVATRRRVRLLNARDLRLVRQIFSGLDGRYEFTRIDETREYLVLAQDDYYRAHDAVVHDRIVPELMP